MRRNRFRYFSAPRQENRRLRAGRFDPQGLQAQTCIYILQRFPVAEQKENRKTRMKAESAGTELSGGRRGGALIKQADGKDHDLGRQVRMLNTVQQQADAVGRNILPF